jgi:hypothetical protein
VGIRETMNKKPALTSGVVIGVIVLALAWMVYWYSPKSTVKPNVSLYFTDDDGKTFYADAMSNLPPYQHNGKEAVLAHVYQIGSNPPFIAYLEKLTPDMQAILSTPSHPDVDSDTGTLVKRPGDADWELVTDSEGREIRRDIKPPAGQTGAPMPVIPGVNGAQ